jgi:hypothetical protein
MFGLDRQTLKRLVLAVLAATVFHAVACIIKRPLEFGDRARLPTFLCAFVSGLISFPFVFAALLLPLRAGLRRYLPRSAQRTRGVVTLLVLLALVAVWIGVPFLHGRELPPYCHGYFWHSLFWFCFVILSVTTFYWPLSAQRQE